MRRVVITGAGAVTPMGNTLKETWSAIKTGQSGIRTYLDDPILKNTSPFNLALVKDFEYNKWKVAHANSRMNNFVFAAMHEALENSGISIKDQNRERIGVCMGIMSSNITKLSEYANQSMKEGYRNINRLSMLQILSNIAVGSLNVKYQILGPSLTVSTACASGLSAVLQAYKWIKLNQADLAFAGGAQDVYNPLCLNSSLRLQALSTKVYDSPGQSSRPFDKQRSGFILGEGAGMLVLEELQHAKQRKANILCEVLGYGCTSDGYHLVRPKQTGESQIRAMKLATNMAGITIKQIDLVNVHATSTKAGDEIEANTIKQVFGDHKPYISAFKGSLGHTFGAAGAIELTLGLKSMQQNFIPKIMNLNDPEVKELNYPKQNIQNEKIKYFIKNSFGFGGVNVSMVFKKYDE